MKRCSAFFCAFLLIVICSLAPRAEAAVVPTGNSASKIELYCTVNADGDCLVSLTATLHIESPTNNLQFPLPPNATDVTMNGGSIFTNRSEKATYADISKTTGQMAGDFPVRFDFKLPKAVSVVKVGVERRLELSIPMLCGFEYPIGVLSFIITLPGAVDSKPTFVSTYQQTGFEANLDLVANGNMLTGASKNMLNDHESVTMSMYVPPEMFPGVNMSIREGNPELVPMLILAGAALLYWLFCLRAFPPVFQRATLTPDSITAGELNCRVTMSGGDLTMMVFSWAQMGYLLIELRGRRVLLHKRMDMGNERSLFEIRIYQALFRNRRTVDCSSAAYAKLCAKTAAMVPGEKAMCRSGSGNRKIYRYILCMAQVFCGINVTMNITSIPLLQWLFGLLFCVTSWFSAWIIQDFAAVLRTRHRLRAWFALVVCLFWVFLGALGGQPWIPLGAVTVQLLASYLVAYGGMRTELNRSEAGEIFGLNRFLRKLQPADVKRLLKGDIEYFFRMAPYAMALGAEKPFCRAFGRRVLVQCPYFITKNPTKRTAAGWMLLMKQAADAMDDRYLRDRRSGWFAVRFRK